METMNGVSSVTYVRVATAYSTIGLGYEPHESHKRNPKK